MTDQTCSEIQRLLLAFLEGALSQAEDDIVRPHLDKCPDCRREAERWVRLDRLLGEHLRAADVVADDDVEAIVTRVRQERPFWRVAPRCVRLWRQSSPLAPLIGLAAALLLVVSYGPTLSLSEVTNVARREVTALVAEIWRAPEKLPRVAVRLHAEARTWPRGVANDVRWGWRRTVDSAEAVSRHVGLMPLALCSMLLAAANLLVARTARAVACPLHGG